MSDNASVSCAVEDIAGLRLTSCGEQDEINPDLFIGLPFDLPPTPEASFWLAELDYVDPYSGDLNDVRLLAERAPSASARDWLRGLLSARSRLETLRPPVL